MPLDRRNMCLAEPKKLSGFTLIELSIVLVIMTLLLGGLLVPLSAQIEQRNLADSQKTLKRADEALLGFAIANGRLPCPASLASQGLEDPVGGGVCTDPYNGFLPAATLGLDNVNDRGQALDGWNAPIRYAITTANNSAFTTSDGLKSAIAASGWTALSPNLVVCTSLNAAGTACASTAQTLSNKSVAIVYSLGKNWATGGVSADEQANLNNDRVFVSHTPSSEGSVNGEFDDVVTWLSPDILYNRMVTAQRLP